MHQNQVAKMKILKIFQARFCLTLKKQKKQTGVKDIGLLCHFQLNQQRVAVVHHWKKIKRKKSRLLYQINQFNNLNKIKAYSKMMKVK